MIHLGGLAAGGIVVGDGTVGTGNVVGHAFVGLPLKKFTSGRENGAFDGIGDHVARTEENDGVNNDNGRFHDKIGLNKL